MIPNLHETYQIYNISKSSKSSYLRSCNRFTFVIFLMIVIDYQVVAFDL